MSCWVVPSLAAEYLGITLEDLQGRISGGTIPSKHDHGFLFVDVAPHSSQPRQVQEGPTYVELSADEIEALRGDESEVEEPVMEESVLEETEDDAVPITLRPDWTGVRQTTGQLRRRPAA
ncbi:MAG TPA: hypothetical protein VGG19_18055 [Tepidisphaeraceae bacterium]|jgi:hypothetical protein